MITMADETRVRIGRTAMAASIFSAIAAFAMVGAIGRWSELIDGSILAFVIMALGFGALVWVMLPAQPRNGAIWTLAWTAFFAGLYLLGKAVQTYQGRVFDDPDAIELLTPADFSLVTAFGMWSEAWPGPLPFFIPLTLSVLLFPDGRAPSRRWKAVGVGAAIAMAVMVTPVAWVNNPWSSYTYEYEGPDARQPEMVSTLFAIGYLSSVVFSLACVFGMILRYRRSDAESRRQIRVVFIGFIGFVFCLSGSALVDALTDGRLNRGDELLDRILVTLGAVVIVTSFSIAVLKFRLYDIDVVISKSVMYLGLLAAITAVYAAIVVGPLVVIGDSEDGSPGLLLPIIATGVVAVLFEPIRARMQRWANRLVYGNRATPHEVLSQVTSRLADTESRNTHDLARIVAEGTAAQQASVWLDEGDELVAVGSWPARESSPRPEEGDDDFTATVDVRHEGERLGVVSITKPRNDAITPTDRELLHDIAAGAGLTLRNIRLNKELEDRAIDVRASRRRLIEAQDRERHRLERDLHDGAQQQVVALKVKLGIAKTVAEREGAETIAAGLTGLADDTQDAVDGLRRVAHGIYPPLLESEGLEPALRAVGRRSTLPFELAAQDLDRYGRSTEAAVYFCVTETLERARMAGATGATVELAGRNGDLTTTIDLRPIETELDLRAIADRIDASGGILTIDQHDRGCRIATSLPIAHVEGAKQ